MFDLEPILLLQWSYCSLVTFCFADSCVCIYCIIVQCSWYFFHRDKLVWFIYYNVLVYCVFALFYSLIRLAVSIVHWFAFVRSCDVSVYLYLICPWKGLYFVYLCIVDCCVYVVNAFESALLRWAYKQLFIHIVVSLLFVHFGALVWSCIRFIVAVSYCSLVAFCFADFSHFLALRVKYQIDKDVTARYQDNHAETDPDNQFEHLL